MSFTFGDTLFLHEVTVCLSLTNNKRFLILCFKCNLRTIFVLFATVIYERKSAQNNNRNNNFLFFKLSHVFLCAQVKSVNLSEGEMLSIRGVDQQGSLLVLANQTLLVEGQVIRSPTNTLSVYYRSTPEGSMGIFQLHYQSESTQHVYTNILNYTELFT